MCDTTDALRTDTLGATDGTTGVTGITAGTIPTVTTGIGGTGGDTGHIATIERKLFKFLIYF